MARNIRSYILLSCILTLTGTLSLAQTNRLTIDDFVLGGGAFSIGNECLRLANEEPWSGGSAWYREPIDLKNSFDLEVDIMLGCDDVTGADGVVFVFSPYGGATGYHGEGMGFAGLRPSLGVEIDTWENEHLGDTPEDHVALLQQGSVDHFYNLEGPVVIKNVEDCSLHHLGISWDATDHAFKVTLDGAGVITYSGDLVENVFWGESRMYWGVTAATGKFFNRHEICFKRLDFVRPIDNDRFHPREEKLLVRGNVSTVDTPFGKGSNTLQTDHYKELNRIINFMREHPQHKVEVIGFTDEMSTPGANKRLSLHRLENIGNYLKKYGIGDDRIVLRDMGQNYPTSNYDEAPYRRKKTRVEVRFFNPRT